MRDRRRELGALGERIAAGHLVGRGYSVLERNFRTRYGELDLVAGSERFLVFCEVKTRIGRVSPWGPLAAVGPRKRCQVRLMAKQWLRERRSTQRRHPPEVRFDAIGIELDPSGRLIELEHVEDAF
jgi:putative endonuclease